MFSVIRWKFGSVPWNLFFAASAVMLACTGWASGQSAIVDAAQSKEPFLTEGRSFSCLDVIKGSVCGVPGEQRSWTPLTASTLFSEGWDEPWISPPSGSGGAPRQGWINVADGHFNRNVFGVYSLTNDQASGGDQHQGFLVFQSPLSRRLYLTVEVPLLSALQGSPGNNDKVTYGDVLVGSGVMIHETQDLSISAHLLMRTPTGEQVTGGGQTNLFPNFQFWYNVADGWVVRGGTGLEVPLNQPNGPGSVLVSTFGVGRVLTPHDAAPFGDLAVFVAGVMRNDLGGDGQTFLSFTPGLRTHLGNDFYLLAGLEVPVTGPKPFDERLIFVLVKGF